MSLHSIVSALVFLAVPSLLVVGVGLAMSRSLRDHPPASSDRR